MLSPPPDAPGGGDGDDSGVKDDRLRLIFTCCHPALSLEARVALTLRTRGRSRVQLQDLDVQVRRGGVERDVDELFYEAASALPADADHTEIARWLDPAHSGPPVQR